MQIQNPIKPTKQSPDACVTACLLSLAEFIDFNIEDNIRNLNNYIIEDIRTNPTQNKEYYYNDGIIKVLIDSGCYIALHQNSKQYQDNNGNYTGRFNNLNITFPNYYTNKLSISDFEQLLINNLSDKRYILIWLDNKKYSPINHTINKYEQHVVAISGYYSNKKRVTLMDRDIFMKENIQITSLEHIFNSLWRLDSSSANERILVIGK